MYSVKNYTENDNIRVLDELGPFKVIEYIKDLSVNKSNATDQYFYSQMNIRKRQVICNLRLADITVQAGAMQWMLGNVSATTGLKGPMDLINKTWQGTVTKETAIKPEYKGSGLLVLEPTYKHILLVNVMDWGGSIVLDDGLFLACDSRLKYDTVRRKNLSTTIAGGEGFFNSCIKGSGVLCLESPVPKEELVEITLDDDVIKIDGNMAIAWSENLEFTVERSGKTLLGSAASGEGLVNTYRGTGKILMAPVV